MYLTSIKDSKVKLQLEEETGRLAQLNFDSIQQVY